MSSAALSDDELWSVFERIRHLEEGDSLTYNGTETEVTACERTALVQGYGYEVMLADDSLLVLKYTRQQVSLLEVRKNNEWNEQTERIPIENLELPDLNDIEGRVDDSVDYSTL